MYIVELWVVDKICLAQPYLSKKKKKKKKEICLVQPFCNWLHRFAIYRIAYGEGCGGKICEAIWCL